MSGEPNIDEMGLCLCPLSARWKHLPGKRAGCSLARETATRKGGRPTNDPDGNRSVKIPGVWLPPAYLEQLNRVVTRYMVVNEVREPEARRAVLMAGVRAIGASLDAMEDQAREASGNHR